MLRSARFIFLAGLIAGLACGLSYAWLINPLNRSQTGPAQLSRAEQDSYILLVSEAYAADGDWSAVERRLAALNDPIVPGRVVELMEKAVREQHSLPQAQHLAALARDLGASSAAVPLFAPPIAPPPAAVATITTSRETAARATSAPARSTADEEEAAPATQAAVMPDAFELLGSELNCDGAAVARLAFFVEDGLGAPRPGAAIMVRWEEGADTFYTGMRPEIDPGFADFEMTPGVVYAVIGPDGKALLSDLQTEPCADGQSGGRLIRLRLIDGAEDAP
jgi:hypothetical protein